MSKVLVIGGAGFIGRTIIKKLVELNHNVEVIDNYSTGDKEELEKILNREVVPKEFISGEYDSMFNDIDYVLHLAAKISVVESITKPTHYIYNNSLGSTRVIMLCMMNHIKKMVFSSSAAIYGDNPINPKTEDMTPNPLSPYALSKLDTEYMLKMYPELKSVVLRYFNVYGPGQRASSPYASAIPIFISKALKDEDITIYGDGNQIRDFVYVDDVANANIHMMLNDCTGTYNVGTGSSITINELVNLVIKLTNSSSKVIHEKERTGEIKVSISSNKKILDTGFTFSSEFEKNLLNTINWYSKII